MAICKCAIVECPDPGLVDMHEAVMQNHHVGHSEQLFWTDG
jgi:hypothetical protein